MNVTPRLVCITIVCSLCVPINKKSRLFPVTHLWEKCRISDFKSLWINSETPKCSNTETQAFMSITPTIHPYEIKDVQIRFFLTESACGTGSQTLQVDLTSCKLGKNDLCMGHDADSIKYLNKKAKQTYTSEASILLTEASCKALLVLTSGLTYWASIDTHSS